MNAEQLNGREKYYKEEIEKLQKERGEREKKWETVQSKLREAEALKEEGKLQFIPASSDDADAGTDEGPGRECDRDVDKVYREVVRSLALDKGSSDWEEGMKQLRKLTGEPEPAPEPEPEPEQKTW
eukprot:COSAG02_NODE_4266_length_5569_cov_14.425594_3_plen_126_part_00